MVTEPGRSKLYPYLLHRLVWLRANPFIFFHFSICEIMTLPKAMLCSSDQYQLWNLLKSKTKNAKRCSSHMSLRNHFCSIFTICIRNSEAHITRMKAKKSLSYLHKENTAGSLVFSSTMQTLCFLTHVHIAQEPSSMSFATQTKRYMPHLNDPQDRVNLLFPAFNLFFSVHSPPPCFCSESQLHNWHNPHARHPTATSKK